VLLDQTGKRPSFSQDDRGYARPGIHVAMLNDRSRTSSFLAGISEVVRPGDVVLDIGTGSGVLAVAAAQAGARHVYAVEASGISRLAQAIFEVNGLDNCVTLLQGWSTSLTLPERADVMVSEMVGNEPLAENLLEMTLDARKRLLKPQARMVPARVKVFGLPLAIPRAGLEKSAVTRAGLRKWLSWYGIDFRPFADAARSSPTSFHVKPQAVRRWKTCGEPVLLADIDFGTTEQLVVDTSRTVLATAAGRLNGLPVYFELGLGPTTCFSTAPAQASPHNHWYSQVWVTPEPLDLKIGDAFTVSYRHRAPGPRVAVTSA
jgi:ubiquinone/menaquinone biosynthesis C-methylase UbiE